MSDASPHHYVSSFPTVELLYAVVPETFASWTPNSRASKSSICSWTRRNSKFFD